MPSTVTELATWACGLCLADAPPGVRQRLALQHLSAAGARRALGPGPAGEGSLAPAGLEDRLFLGHDVGAGRDAAARHPGGSSVGELLRATLAANEVGARVGAALLLGGAAEAPVAAAAAAVARGVLAGDPAALAEELAAALGGGPDVLDAGSPLFTAPRLGAAFTGLGRAWLTGTLAFSLTPGHRLVATAVEGTHEILRRHVKAADKRLRPDQVEAIELLTAAPLPGFPPAAPPADGEVSPATVPASARLAVGVLVAAHDFGPAQLQPGTLAPLAAGAAEVAARTRVVVDWGRSAAALAHTLDVAAPLFAGAAPGALVRWLVQGRPEVGMGGTGDGPRAALRRVLGARPDRVLRAIARATPDLGAARLEAWQLRTDTEVRLHTTRGGTWPERRTVPEGAPGWPWQDTVTRLLARAEADPSVLEVDDDADAAQWLADLAR